MYELIQISEHDYYIDCPAKIGLVRVNDTDVVAIDSGNDKEAGKKVLRHIQANGWQLTAIYNTHSHADHIGGNKFLQERTGCRIFASGLEAAYTNAPKLESMTLYGGLPFKDLQNKFLLAQSSSAELLTAEVLPDGWNLIHLPGHCFDMVGFRTKDGNVFLGDCLSSRETLQKYGLGYLWDPAAFITTLEQVKTLQAAHFIPAHAPVTEDIVPLAQLNIDAVMEISLKILSCCVNPATFEELLQQMFQSYNLTMTAQQYALIGSTLRSYLSSLYAQGKITFSFENNRMLWHCV